MDYTHYFKKGGWAAMGRYYATHPGKLKRLLKRAKRYASREGLQKVKGELLLVCQYVRDVFPGRYKDYNVLNLTVIVGAIVYVVAPVDVLPDFMPLTGLVDDTAILLWATSEFSEELERYRQYVAARTAAEGVTGKEEEIEDVEFEEIPPFSLPKT